MTKVSDSIHEYKVRITKYVDKECMGAAIAMILLLLTLFHAFLAVLEWFIYIIFFK